MPIGSLMIDLEGVELSQEERELLQQPLVGGVILFSRNYQSPEQLETLIYTIRNCRDTPLLVAVDQEGGRVQRFCDGFTTLPSLAKLGEAFDEDPEHALELCEAAGWLMAIELLAVGVDISFAPVLDLRLGISKVMRDRSFHAEPKVVTELAEAYIRGMNHAGMQAVGKHFPGHGSVCEDSHSEIPKDERSPEQLLQADIVPFTRLAKRKLAGIMSAHIIFERFDAKPVSFSKYWLQRVLRQQAQFKGAIFSDDLSMAGAEVIGNFSERAQTALTAGCDMILVCNNRAGVHEIATNLSTYSNLVSGQRLLRMCGQFYYTRTELLHSRDWQHAIELLRSLPCC